MRDIKFRAWDKRSETMEYFSDLFWFEENGVNEYIGHEVRTAAGCYTIEQFTGIRDIDGKEIYEGDIVFSPYRTSTGIIEIGEASYIGIGAKIYGIIWNGISPLKREPWLYESGQYDWEIIGNIHEGVKA